MRSGLPGSVVRVLAPGPGGEPGEHVVVFAEDGLTTEIGGGRHRLGMWSGFSDDGDELVLDRAWLPEDAAYELPAWVAVVDVPAEAQVRFYVDGVEVPVCLRDGAFVADLTALRDSRTDRGQPWQLHVRMRGVSRSDYRGVHLGGTQHRRTSAHTVVVPPRWDVMRLAVDSGGGGEVGAGMTVGDFVVAHRELPVPAGVVYEPDVPYAPDRDPALLASVHRRADPAERAPVVLLVHGGGWQHGDRGSRRTCAHALAERGYVTVNIEYRHYPQADWRGSVADVRAALDWIRAHAHELGADPDRLAIVGESAGAHLAAMATIGQPPGTISALALFYPPVDLVAVLGAWGPAFEEFAAEYFGGDLVVASPASHVGSGWPPVLTLIGDEDALIDLGPVRHFHAALDGVGVENRLVVYPRCAHGFDLFERGGGQATSGELSDFLAAHLR